MSSPTSALESLLVTFLIDAHEDIHTGVYDVPRTRLQESLVSKDNGKRVLAKLVGKFVDIVCKANPEHEKNLLYENGQKVLCMKTLQEIHGCIESSLIWYSYAQNPCKRKVSS